jgi:hypothetical protein
MERTGAKHRPYKRARQLIVQVLLTFLLIPVKVVSDSDLIPVTRSDAKPVTVGAKQRWRSYRA